MKEKAITLLCMLMLLLIPSTAIAQGFGTLRLPSSMCDNDTLRVRFGSEKWNEVEVVLQEASLGHTDTVFLPDGVPCNDSCAYRSPVTFTAFRPDDTLRSAEDIKYIRIKMEHSYIADIYIMLECPDGRKADLLRFAGTGESECTSTIPKSSRGWKVGENMSEACYLGYALDVEDPLFPCDAQAPDNGPGKGWNYCWSNNTTSGYSYASGDGIIYRAAHQHGGRVDSSNVFMHKNFYHPDEHFKALTGCPLNGTWSVTVVDGFSQDNGYIFEWELSLDASLIPYECTPEKYNVLGGSVIQTSDTSFLLLPPPPLDHDTAVNYTFRMVTSCGDTIDSTTTIVYHPTPEAWAEDEVCQGEGYYISGHIVYGGGEHIVPITLPTGCDSTVHLLLTERPSYDLNFYDSICINRHTTFEGVAYGETGSYQHSFHTQYGCDSLRTLHLTIIDANLQAHILAVPPVVEYETPNIRLYDASKHNVTRLWTVGNESNDLASFTIEYPQEYDSLPITLIAISAHACADTDTLVARMERALVSVPTVFTPNQESNNTWKPVAYDVLEIDTWVYNRTGQAVAHLEGTDAAWDGHAADGTPCPQGCYLYTIRYRSVVRPYQVNERKGSVTIIR